MICSFPGKHTNLSGLLLPFLHSPLALDEYSTEYQDHNIVEAFII